MIAILEIFSLKLPLVDPILSFGRNRKVTDGLVFVTPKFIGNIHDVYPMENA